MVHAAHDPRAHVARTAKRPGAGWAEGFRWNVADLAGLPSRATGTPHQPSRSTYQPDGGTQALRPDLSSTNSIFDPQFDSMSGGRFRLHSGLSVHVRKQN